MSTDNKDRTLEEFLAGSSPVSRSYRDMGNPQPSPELDRAVLAEARRASRARVYSKSRVRWNTWFVAATVAATVALSITLVLEVTTFGPMYDEMTAPQPAPAAAPETILRPSIGDDSEGPAEEEALPARDRKATLAKNEAENRALDAERANIPDLQSVEDKRAPKERSLSLIQEELAAVAGKRPDKIAKDDGAQLASVGQAAEGTVLVAGLEKDRAEDMAAEPVTEAPQASGTGGRLQTAKSTSVGFASLAPADADAVPGYPAPDVWLAGIRYLQARGETERANEELKKFQAVYPDYRPANSGE